MRFRLLSFEGDFHSHAVAWCLRLAGVEAELTDLSAAIGHDGGALARTNQTGLQILNLPCDDGVWVRKPATAQFLPPQTDDETLYEIANREETLGLALDGLQNVICAQARCINPPTLSSACNNKLYQLWAARRAGFNVPRTLIGSAGRSALAFVDQVDRAVYKPLRHNIWPIGNNQFTTLHTTEITRSDIVVEDSASNLAPGIFQELVLKKYELRVTVIGEVIIACRIERPGGGDHVDWRQASREADPPSYRVVSLPSSVEACIFDLKRILKIGFFIVDLVVDQSEGVYFLEVNPFGQFLFPESHNPEIPMLHTVCAGMYSWLTGETFPVAKEDAALTRFKQTEQYQAFVTGPGREPPTPISRKSLSVFDPIAHTLGTIGSNPTA